MEQKSDLISFQSFPDLGPVYTTTNTQRIAIYPGQFKFIPVKILPDLGRLHCKHAKDNQISATFFTTGNLSGLPCLHACKYKNCKNCIKICSVIL